MSERGDLHVRHRRAPTSNEALYIESARFPFIAHALLQSLAFLDVPEDQRVRLVAVTARGDQSLALVLAFDVRVLACEPIPDAAKSFRKSLRSLRGLGVPSQLMSLYQFLALITLALNDLRVLEFDGCGA